MIDTNNSYTNLANTPSLNQSILPADPVTALPKTLPLHSNHNPIRILRLPEVMERVGLKHSSIYHYIAQGSFPKQVTLGGNSVGWVEHEIDTWLAARIQAR